MEIRFENKVALVTGAESGIGKATALALAQAGCQVALTYFKDADAAGSLQKEIQNLTPQCITVQMDIRDEISVSLAFQKVLSHFPKIDFLINSAGIRSNDKYLTALSFEEFNNTLTTNLFGIFNCCKAFVKQPTLANGRIINISSIHSQVVSAGKTDYCSSKFAIEGFSKALALELAPSQTTVNCVAPGMILTPMNEKALHDLEYRKTTEQRIPLNYAAFPDEVVPMIVFLCSEQAKYITGATHVVDGGLSLNRASGSK